MSDWEDNDHDNIPVRVSKPNKWNDEDVEEDDVKDNWDESSDEDDEKTKTTTTSAAPQKKKISAAKKAIAKKMNNNDVNEEEDELERKKREQQAIKDADMENAKEMFQGITVKETEVDKASSKKLNNSSQSVTRETLSPLDKINPKTKEEFDKFSKLLIERIQKHEKQSLYANFINGFVRELCLPLKDTEARKVANTLTTLANEKQKPKTKKKTNNKPVLQVENFDSVDAADYVDYDVYDDDYEDYM
ncbi:hypothetical protein RclHR1_01670008 [Rhizophagus clarus]|uniref:Eukaryotic translation initiation factor 3 subunit J n=1 Tax=Rhizophagus clarus TaxID=94130 RepID=A0A2Z6QI53_9GLOM|nr:hypothetical protein RclHR1_01670008 [Rhizophagus clarus]GES96076.1 eukaryotic translation initiation factor 3 subunit J [Rhizophagus clarus]